MFQREVQLRPGTIRYPHPIQSLLVLAIPPQTLLFQPLDLVKKTVQLIEKKWEVR